MPEQRLSTHVFSHKARTAFLHFEILAGTLTQCLRALLSSKIINKKIF